MERQSNLELLRIIAMIMVITVHYVGHGRVLDNVEVFSLNFYYFIYILITLIFV